MKFLKVTGLYWLERDESDQELMQSLGMLTASTYLYYTLRFNFLVDIYWLRGKIWIISLNSGGSSNAQPKLLE